MPELPEVETVRRGLEAAIKNATIEKVLLRRKDLRIPFPPGMAKALAGARIVRVGRRAKYLLFTLDNGWVLVAHLGMSGRFSVFERMPAALLAHDHVVFALSDNRVVIYHDPRRFGLMTLAREADLKTHPLLAELGPEPLEKTFDETYLRRALGRRKGPVKPALMDQKLVVGVGNIYASEALFHSGISPRRPAKEAAKDAEKLVSAIRKVLRAAIASGGSSLRDFAHVGGEAGFFQHSFAVYGKKGSPCEACETPIKDLRQAGRATYFCPRCQVR